MSTTAKELIEAATNYKNWSLPHGHPEKGFCDWLLSDVETARRHRDDACEAMASHILSTVREDDDEPVTVEWVDAETPLVNRSTSPYSRNYLIRGGVRLAASAKPGGFEPCVLWCGSANEFYEVGTPTRGDVRALLRGLRVPFNK